MSDDDQEEGREPFIHWQGRFLPLIYLKARMLREIADAIERTRYTALPNSGWQPDDRGGFRRGEFSSRDLDECQRAVSILRQLATSDKALELLYPEENAGTTIEARDTLIAMDYWLRRTEADGTRGTAKVDRHNVARAWRISTDVVNKAATAHGEWVKREINKNLPDRPMAVEERARILKALRGLLQEERTMLEALRPQTRKKRSRTKR